MKRMKAIFAILLALGLAVMLVGCAGKAESARSTYMAEAPAAAYDGAYAESYSGDAKAVGMVSTAATNNQISAESANLTGAAAGRKIIKNGDLSIQTREFDEFIDNLKQAIAAAGGYVESSSINGNSYGRGGANMRSANYTVRIPADNLDAFCDQVSDIGNVTYKNLYTRDVTLTYVDLESHVKALRTEQQTLMDLLGKAQSVEDIIVIQNRLSDVIYEIESYESTLRTFDDQIAYSSVNLSIQEVQRETAVEKETAGEEISRRFKENWEDVKEGVIRFGINFVSDLPILLVWAVILGGIAFIIVRIIKGEEKRRAKRERRQAKKRQEAYQKEQARRKAQESEVKVPEGEIGAPKEDGLK